MGPIIKVASAYSNAFDGVDFTMPYVRPLSTASIADIPVGSSMALIASPNNAAIMGHERAGIINQGLSFASNGFNNGMISPLQLAQGLSRAGVGYFVGQKAAMNLGTLFSQEPEVKETMKNVGAIGGAILNSGIL